MKKKTHTQHKSLVPAQKAGDQNPWGRGKKNEWSEWNGIKLTQITKQLLALLLKINMKKLRFNACDRLSVHRLVHLSVNFKMYLVAWPFSWSSPMSVLHVTLLGQNVSSYVNNTANSMYTLWLQHLHLLHLYINENLFEIMVEWNFEVEVIMW